MRRFCLDARIQLRMEFSERTEQKARAPSWVARKTTRGAWPASKASCQRGAHKHQRSPDFSPGKPNAGTGVERSLPHDFEKSRNSAVITAQTVASDILLPRVAAAVPIKPRHRLHRTDFEWLAEHVSSRLLGMAAIITGIPQHCRPSVIAMTSFHRCDSNREQPYDFGEVRLATLALLTFTVLSEWRSRGVVIARSPGQVVSFRSSPTVFADTPMPRSTSTRILSGKP
jgi:hypothetical protein